MSTTTITTAGIDTVDVGVISGEVDITTTVSEQIATVVAAYSGAAEAYTVTGSGLPTALTEAEAHDRVITALSAEPGRDANGNVGSVSLTGLAL